VKKQKSTDTVTTTKKRNRREAKKYPALERGVNLCSRRYYIEADYIDGVYDKDGRELIPPLPEEAKKFLNQFYEETIVTNFQHDPDIRKLNKVKKNIIEDDTVKEITSQIKELKKNPKLNAERIKELFEIRKLIKKQNEETYAERLCDIEEELQEARESKLLYPNPEDHKKFYTENNKRNVCLFNQKQKTGSMRYLEEDKYDSFLGEKYDDLDTEEYLIYNIERSEREHQEDREEAVRKAQKLQSKKSKA
jgi:hypothetical protein